MQYRFFLYHYGPVYVRCKKVNRGGQVFFRDSMGNEMPAHKTAKRLSGEERDKFVGMYNQETRGRIAVHMSIHPEDNTYTHHDLTYEEILEEIRNMES